MKIADFNLTTEPIDRFKEALSLFPATLLADKLVIASTLSDYIIPYCTLNNMSDEEVATRLAKFEKDDPDTTEEYLHAKSVSNDMMRITNKKHKTKNELHITNLLRKQRQLSRELLLNYCETELIKLKLTQLVQFYHEDIWDVRPSLTEENENTQNPYITELLKTISENEYLLLMNLAGEKGITFSDVYSQINMPADLILLPLWHFPYFDEITFSQLKYTVNDLNPQLKSFKEDLKHLKSRLFSDYFTFENFNFIKQLCDHHISHHIVPVQNAIHDSLYISQHRNMSKNSSIMQFFLGITSVEILVSFFEKSGIIPPYVASETKDQLSKHIDLRTAIIFCFVGHRKN